MLGITHGDGKRYALAMLSAMAFHRVEHQPAITPARHRHAGTRFPAAPAADGGHLLVVLPFPECVVGSVNRDESTTLLDPTLEGAIHFVRPRFAVVVRDHQCV